VVPPSYPLTLRLLTTSSHTLSARDDTAGHGEQREEAEMPPTALPHWFTVPDAATEAGVSPWLLRKEVREGRLRARRVGRLMRILDSDLAAWMEGR
jgi:excisionase family DNA binding protein